MPSRGSTCWKRRVAWRAGRGCRARFRPQAMVAGRGTRSRARSPGRICRPWTGAPCIRRSSTRGRQVRRPPPSDRAAPFPFSRIPPCVRPRSAMGIRRDAPSGRPSRTASGRRGPFADQGRARCTWRNSVRRCPGRTSTGQRVPDGRSPDTGATPESVRRPKTVCPRCPRTATIQSGRAGDGNRGRAACAGAVARGSPGRSRCRPAGTRSPTRRVPPRHRKRALRRRGSRLLHRVRRSQPPRCVAVCPVRYAPWLSSPPSSMRSRSASLNGVDGSTLRMLFMVGNASPGRRPMARIVAARSASWSRERFGCAQ